MQKSPRKLSRKLIAVVLIVVVVAAAVGVYAILTYPRTVLSFPVSFTLGADVENKEFDVPFLHRQVQVEVMVSSGTSLWTARILSQGNVVWSHSAAQGGQTTYQSDWTELASGHYNFTFATAGFGSLDAEVKVTSKGGFW